MTSRTGRATLLALVILAVAAPQASALTRQVLAPVTSTQQTLQPVLSEATGTLREVAQTVAPDLVADLHCASGALPTDLRLTGGAPVWGGCTALGITCEPPTFHSRTCGGAIGPLRLRCETTSDPTVPRARTTCSQAVGDEALGLTRSCTDEGYQNARSGTYSMEECVTTANAGGASVALTCDRLYQSNSFTGAVEDEGCASGPLSVRCTYASAVDELRETCAARLTTSDGAVECRIVFHRDGGTPAQPGRIRNVDAQRSGCGAV